MEFEVSYDMFTSTQWELVFMAAASVMQSSSKELSTLVADRV